MSTQTHIRSICLIAFVLLHFGATVAPAQSLVSLSGYVLDPTQAVLQGVEVTAINNSTNWQRTVVTNESGWYFFSQLLPGTYTLTAKRDGFNMKVVQVPLSVSDTVSMDLQLEVGAVSTRVEVAASAESLKRVNAQLGNTFDRRTITDLPLQTGNTVRLFELFPGVNLSQQLGEFARNDGSQVNGARNDQQTIEQDGININQQEQGGALDTVLPVPTDSIQEFAFQTAGFGGGPGRASGGQIQLVTRSGSNSWHGSVYENYRTTGTSARNYFSVEPTPLIRHRPGVSVGGPIVQNKLFFFGNYEYQSDRSGSLQTRTIPTPDFLNGVVRYRRADGSIGAVSDGPGSNLEQFTLVPGDRWNSGLIGPAGSFEKYRPFSTDTMRTSPSAQDNGVNILTYRFNAPFVRDRNVYVSRIDYNLNSNNTFYARGTLNDDVRTLAGETFPGFNNASERLDNSKGFAVNWNSAITSKLNSSLSVGLTRESFENTGNQVAYYNPSIFSNLVQASAVSRQAIDTWQISENIGWQAGKHVIQAGVSHRSIDNFYRGYLDTGLSLQPVFSGVANLTANVTSALQRALGAEYANVASPATLGDALLVATGSTSRLTESAQFGLDSQPLPAASPFVRNFILQEWDFFVEDAFKLRHDLTLTAGLHYSLQTPPYERNGVQMNWTQDLGQRWHEMTDTTKTVMDFPLLATEVGGRANDLPDFYEKDKNNFAPRVSVAWALGGGNGSLSGFANKGGPTIIRAGYALTYDRIGGRFGRDAAIFGSIGLLTTYSTPGNTFSVDGLGTPRAARIGPDGSLPRDAFPIISQPNHTLPYTPGAAGGLTTTGIDPAVHSPSNHLMNITISKQLPGGWTAEASYVGRFARDLLGQVDIASPPNFRDATSGMTWYEATNELYTRYLEQGAPVSSVQPIAWYENAYPEIKGFVEGRLGKTFSSATQAWYAFLLQQTATGTALAPGPNAQVSQIDRVSDLERGLGKNKLLNPQVQFLGLWANVARSNYHAGQFTAQKRFGRGFNVTLNYTLSKSMDVTSAAEARGLRPNGQTGEGLAADPLNPGLSYGLSDFDRRHQFSGYFLGDLPFGRNMWLGSNAGSALNQIIGGWQVSGIVMGASGRPWNFTDNRFNHHFAGRDTPVATQDIPFELTKQAGLPGSGIPVVYLIPGTAADRTRIGRENFKNSHPGGAIARNQGQGPGYWNVDMSVTKNFDLSGIRESMRLRFRWETFNLFNHPNFDIPGFNPNGGPTNIDRAGTLGQVENTLGTERVMQFGVRLEF